MAQTWTSYSRNADQTKRVCSQLMTLVGDIGQLKGDYDANLFDPTATPTPDYVTLDPDGMIQGADFSPADHVFAMQLFEQFLLFLDNGTPAQQDYRATLERVAEVVSDRTRRL